MDQSKHEQIMYDCMDAEESRWIDRLRAELAAMTDRRDRAMLATEEAEAKVRTLGAWKIRATEILFRLHINEEADEQDITDARALLDLE